jgi:uncharacterized metal-binding protein YceD (DUF177 family)
MEPTDGTESADSSPEFSRIVNLEDLGEEELRLDLRATDEECAALARRFGLPAIEALSATGRLRRSADGGVRLGVSIRAQVTQTCVVTLEPVVNRIEEDIDIVFEPEPSESGAPDVEYDPEVDREKLTGDSLDVGEIVAEEAALSLDPYPRRPGVALEPGDSGSDSDGGATSTGGPFEALAALKRKD